MTKLLGGLPAGYPIPIVVVQHRSKDSDTLLVRLLQDTTELKVCEIEDKDVLCKGTVHIAPADYHVLIEPGCSRVEHVDYLEVGTGRGELTRHQDRIDGADFYPASYLVTTENTF